MRKLLKPFSKFNISRILILLILLFFFIIISAFSYVSAVSNNISDSVFRLHVIANSNTDEDQELKYIVRNELLSYMNTIAKDAKTKGEAIEIAKQHSNEFHNIAIQTIKNQGYNYDVNIQIGNFPFPTKDYGDISLPAGYYDALKVEIGEAKGENWWCVLFPTLCFVDIDSSIVSEDSKQEMKNTLSEEEFSLISKENNSEIKFKFKLIELLQNVNIQTAKNGE